jgi:hypothetical protein
MNADLTYTPQEAMVVAQLMSNIISEATIDGASFAQKYIVRHGLKKFRQCGADARTKEMDQLHRRNCFTPANWCGHYDNG